jgi:protein AbiQ
MDNIKLYEISPAYINYLAPAAPHLFQNKKAGQQNERKYIGVVLTINGMDYFAPLSSFKEGRVGAHTTQRKNYYFRRWG